MKTVITQLKERIEENIKSLTGDTYFEKGMKQYVANILLLIDVELLEKEREQLQNAQMDMFNHLNNLPYGLDYISKRDSAEEFTLKYYKENYGK